MASTAQLLSFAERHMLRNYKQPALVIARVAQSIGAAFLLPTSLGLLLPEFPPARRGAAVGIWAAAAVLVVAISYSGYRVFLRSPAPQQHARGPQLHAAQARTAGQPLSATGSVFSWLMNGDSAITGLPANSIAG